MKEFHNLLSTIRDSKLLDFRLEFKPVGGSIEFILSRFGKEIKIQLTGITEIRIFDDLVEQEYIGQIKGLKDKNNDFWISLDPYDERIDKIEERDNYVFKFKDFKIK